MTQEPQPQSPADLSPHLVNAALRRRLQQCYDHGTKLAAQESYDFDYAHTLFAECVMRDPGNLMYVDAMLQNLQRKYHNNKKGSRLAMFAGKGPLKKAVSHRAWAVVLELGPDALKSNPWDTVTLRAMADACAAYGYTDVELRYLRNALDANPRDAEVNRHCALSLARIGNFDQAIACWHRVEEARPTDPEPPEMINRLQLDKTHARAAGHAEGSRGKAVHKHGGSASPAESRSRAEPPKEHDLEEPAAKPRRREIEQTPRQKLEQALSYNPNDTDSYLELAQLHLDEHRFADAERVLARGLAATGNNLAIQDQLDQVQILRVRHQLAIAEQRARAEGTDEAKQLVGQLRDELHRVELDVYRRRNLRQPNDLETRFELAVRLRQVGNLSEALNQFQTLKDIPEFRVRVALECGECYQRARQYAKALQHYQRAAELAGDTENQEIRKLALYRAGLLAAGVRDNPLARRCLQALVDLDPTYKDARERLDKLE